MGRPYAMPPGVPQDRFEEMAKALEATLKDPEFKKDADQAKFSPFFTSGKQLEQVLNDV